MRITQLQEITTIDSEIITLHEKLQSLYEQRADLAGGKDNGLSWVTSDTIDLSGIDLTL